jgi:kynureninase
MNHAFTVHESDALALDRADPLASLRSQFLIPTLGSMSEAVAALDAPKVDANQPCVYLTGNSLGLQPRGVAEALMTELRSWAGMGVEAHTHGPHPWLPYHEELRDNAAKLVGAKPSEVVVMNSLTVNLHLLMLSFYRPAGVRRKIIIEDSAFPSDSHAVASQASLHGLAPNDAIVRLKPRAGEAALRTEDILASIDQHKHELALVMLSGVNYYTGQWFEMEKITEAGHAAGALVGWDLAHAAGNVPMKLHEWGADFACWCSYKYLNSGPGALAGAFVHEKHVSRSDLRQLAGWWGNDPKTRFAMGPEFVPVHSADRWQLSNPPIFSMAPVRVSLELFATAGMDRLREKSVKLTAYLAWWIDRVNEKHPGAVRVLTPSDPGQRGCQLSMIIRGGRAAHAKLLSLGVVTDYREPDVIRAAPVPMYNSFHDVWRFGSILMESLS